MSTRLRNFSTWATLLALVLTLLMGSGAVVYCVGPGGHAAVEIVHGEHPEDNPLSGEQETPRKIPKADWVSGLVSTSECVDQTMVKQAITTIVSPASELTAASATILLLYELPPLEDVSSFSHFSRWQDASVHPDAIVVQSVILLI